MVLTTKNKDGKVGKRTKFILTNHAINRWNEKFPIYALGGFPLWKALELAEPADESMWTRLEIQSINKTANRRRADLKTYYFLFKGWDGTCVFVSYKNEIDQYVVMTCWALESQSNNKNLKIPNPQKLSSSLSSRARKGLEMRKIRESLGLPLY